MYLDRLDGVGLRRLEAALHAGDPVQLVGRPPSRVPMDEIAKHDFNLNISRYISTAVGEEEIDLAATHNALTEIESTIKTATAKHNAFLKELGKPLLP